MPADSADTNDSFTFVSRLYPCFDQFLMHDMPGCVSCSSSIILERYIVGTMTFVQHRTHPTATTSVSSAAIFSGQRCNTYCRIRDNTGSVVASLIIVAATGPPVGDVEPSDIGIFTDPGSGSLLRAEQSCFNGFTSPRKPQMGLWSV